MKIKFLETYKVNAADGPEYKAGEIYDLSEPSARHFMRKGRAEIAPAATVTTPEVMPPEVKEAIEKTEQKTDVDKGTVGARGGDPVKRFSKAQSAFAKKDLEGDE